MKPSHTYDFRQVTMEDLDLLNAWQSHPHVREWWSADEPYDERDLNDPLVARWIVSTNGNSFGFMQDYGLQGLERHHFAHLPEGTRGIDQFIGDPKMIGLGHGSAFIAQRMQALCERGVPVIATDPHPENTRAIAVYRKLGFEVFGPPQETEWGLILPMKAVL